ncbi:MAG: carboxymuconolactone decarboxylase family protein [Cytophagales bacterium]|nr:carboxymuconolactone decarboxylase family protein [Cytophagales bacterium]
MERISYQDIPQGMFDKLMAIESFIHESNLEMQLLEILRLRVSQINGCTYCMDMHHKELKATGETELRLSTICAWKDAPYFSDREKAALAFAEAITTIHQHTLTEEVFEGLSVHFSKAEIAYLTLAVSQINTWTRMMKTFKFTPGRYKVPERQAVS